MVGELAVVVDLAENRADEPEDGVVVEESSTTLARRFPLLADPFDYLAMGREGGGNRHHRPAARTDRPREPSSSS